LSSCGVSRLGAWGASHLDHREEERGAGGHGEGERGVGVGGRREENLGRPRASRPDGDEPAVEEAQAVAGAVAEVLDAADE